MGLVLAQPGAWHVAGRPALLSSAILSPRRCSPAHASAKPVQAATQPDLARTCYLRLLRDKALTLRQPPPPPPSHTQQGGKGGGAGQGFSVLELESRLL